MQGAPVVRDSSRMHEPLPQPKVITFDCYDTLCEFRIDEVTPQILAERAAGINLAALLADFEALRFATTTHGPYQPYHVVLCETLRKVMTSYNLAYDDADGEALLAAVRTWGPYPDVPPALRLLRQHCQLAIITNSDDDIMAENVARIGVPIDHVITAQQAGAYKPATQTFAYALERIGVSREEVLHVAQGFDYDIMPAHALGWRRVWINRYGKQGDPAYGPYHELPDLAGLPKLLGISSVG